jgi:hypothetical protein
MHACARVCMCVHVCACVCMCVHGCTWVYTGVHVCACVCMCVLMYVPRASELRERPGGSSPSWAEPASRPNHLAHLRDEPVVTYHYSVMEPVKLRVPLVTRHSPLGHVRGANRDAVLAVEPHAVGPCHLPSQLAQENYLGNGAQLPSGSRLRCCCCRAVAVCDPSSEACCHRGGCVPNLSVAEEQRTTGQGGKGGGVTTSAHMWVIVPHAAARQVNGSAQHPDTAWQPEADDRASSSGDIWC